MTNGHPTWTEERTELMLKLLSDGLTAAAVGRLLKVSRNAVIGKAHRLGKSVAELNGHHVVKRKRERPRLSLYGNEVSKRPSPRYRPVRAPVINLPERVVEPTFEELHKNRCNIMQLTLRTCRWPLWGHDGTGERFYCGAPVATRCYCDWHKEVATQAPYPRVRREPSKPFVIKTRPAKPPKSIEL